MPHPRPLTPAEARRTLAHRFTRVADNLRQLATKFGIRPMRVFLVWTRWSGTENGEGREEVLQELEILPTPRIVSLDNLALSPLSTGVLPVGSVRVTEVSTSLTYDQLTGRMFPVAHEEHIPEPFTFFYELREDGRGDDPPKRMKFRLFNEPTRNAENVEWTFVLQRVSEDRNRQGQSRYGTGDE